MRHPQLMHAQDRRVINVLEFAGTTEMLCFERFAAEYVGGSNHFDEVLAGHGWPELVEKGAVVDADCGGDDFGKAVPVLEGVLVVVEGNVGEGDLLCCRRSRPIRSKQPCSLDSLRRVGQS